MSERLQGHRTKLNANKMTCDGRCLSRRKQPVFSSFSRTVQSSGVAWTWAATLTPWRNLADCSTLALRPRERHGRRRWTAAMEERQERVLMPSAGATAYRGRRHAVSRWRGTVAQDHGDSGKWERRACTQSAAPPSANVALAEVTSRNHTSATRTRDEQRHSTRTAVCWWRRLEHPLTWRCRSLIEFLRYICLHVNVDPIAAFGVHLAILL